MPFHQTARLWTFQIVVGACLLFIVLSGIAMLLYPGGTRLDKATTGYSFFDNFFSELGLTQSYSGLSNEASAPLFGIALSCAGVALILFFLVFAPFFTRSIYDRALAWLGSIVGIISGACFIGIALTPLDVDLDLHITLVLAAFRTFFIAVLLYLPPLFRERRQPRPSPIVFVCFAVLLGAYILLLAYGPNPDTLQGIRVQVIGQKIIAYACISSILLESIGAIQFMRRSGRI